MTVYKDIKDLRVEDIYQLVVGKPATIHMNMELKDAVEPMLQNTISQKVYVVNDKNQLIGTITLETILRKIGYIYGVRKPGVMSFFQFLREILKESVIEFMEKDPVKVTKDDKILDALKLMVTYHLNNLPVVDENDVIIGELNGIEILMKSVQK